MTPESRITVIDEDNSPLLVMEEEEVHRQQLLHRGAGLIIRDRQQRLLLHRLPAEHPLYPHSLDIAGCGHVPHEECAEATAELFLPEELRESSIQLERIAEIPNGMGTGREVVTIFEAVLSPAVAALLRHNNAYFFADHDELAALSRDYPDQLTPDLRTLLTADLCRSAGLSTADRAPS